MTEWMMYAHLTWSREGHHHAYRKHAQESCVSNPNKTNHGTVYVYQGQASLSDVRRLSSPDDMHSERVAAVFLLRYNTYSSCKLAWQHNGWISVSLGLGENFWWVSLTQDKRVYILWFDADLVPGKTVKDFRTSIWTWSMPFGEGCEMRPFMKNIDNTSRYPSLSDFLNKTFVDTCPFCEATDTLF